MPGHGGLPPSLEGFDLSRGLRFADGDESFYLKLLHRFRGQLEGEFSDLGAQLERGADGATCRAVHTLKGLAGTVGAVQLANLGASIDHALRRGETIGPARCRELDRAIREAREQLATLSPLTGTGGEGVGPAQAAGAIPELLRSLQNSELVDDDLLAAVVSFFHGHLGDQQAAALKSLVENFEHDRAAAMLLELAARVGVEIR